LILFISKNLSGSILLNVSISQPAGYVNLFCGRHRDFSPERSKRQRSRRKST
jgi:hypothetical protein